MAAELGSSYGQQGLAACLKRLGKDDEALGWLKMSSDNGRAESSRLLFWHFKRAGNAKFALEYLARAAQQGHTLSAQGVAWNKIFGKYGVSKIPQGIVELVKNSPKTIAYAKDYMNKHPDEFESGIGKGIFR
jgi:TPR repeat protein